MASSERRNALWKRGVRALPNYLLSDLVESESPMEDGERPNSRVEKLGKALRHLSDDTHVPRGRLAFYDLHPDFRLAHEKMRNLYTKEFRSRLEKDEPFSLFTVPVPRDHLGVDLTKLISGTYLLENGIAQGDRLSMTNSVELRLPLVDHVLVQKIIGLRKNYPDHRKPPKAWLREAFSGLLPEAIVERKKQPFEAPLRDWHRKLFDAYGDLLANGYLVELGVLRPEAARYLAAGWFPEGAGSTLSFKALVLELWCRTIRHSKQETKSLLPPQDGQRILSAEETNCA